MDTTVSQQDLENALEALDMSADTPDVYRALIEANLEVTALVDAIEAPAREAPARLSAASKRAPAGMTSRLVTNSTPRRGGRGWRLRTVIV